MKLREIKTRTHHYFTDEQGRRQGQYKDWYESGQQRIISHWRDGRIHGECKRWHRNGQQWVICHFRDGELHGEYKGWDKSGELEIHTFDINGKEIIDFLKNPELYPSTPEEKTMFSLKYGNAPFISEGEVE